MGRLPIRVVVVSAAMAALVFVALVLGFVAESANSKSFVGYDGTYCVYRRTAALGCGIVAALFLIAGQTVLGASSGCFGRCGEARARPICARRRRIVASMYGIYWYVVRTHSHNGTRKNSIKDSHLCVGLSRGRTLAVATTFMFLYGAWQNRAMTSRPTRGRYHSRSGCRMILGRGVFASAAASSALAFFFRITAYVYQEMSDPKEPQGGAAMGQQPHFHPQ
ncbi:hypothetical protein ACQ4PT_028697 [Festuca glaucescens]